MRMNGALTKTGWLSIPLVKSSTDPGRDGSLQQPQKDEKSISSCKIVEGFGSSTVSLKLSSSFQLPVTFLCELKVEATLSP